MSKFRPGGGESMSESRPVGGVARSEFRSGQVLLY